MWLCFKLMACDMYQLIDIGFLNLDKEFSIGQNINGFKSLFFFDIGTNKNNLFRSHNSFI